MIQRIRRFLKTEYEKTLSVNKEIKKTSISHVAGKTLLVFFAMMLLFTIVSRAADAFTVTRVVVENPKRDILNRTLTGVGYISLADEKCINVIPGYRIDKVYVSPGESVKTDTVLFSYSMDDLQKKYDSIEVDIENIKIQTEQAQLNITPTEQLSTQAPLLSLKQAKDNLKVAKTDLSVMMTDYDKNVVKTKEELLQDKKKEYTEAVKKTESLLLSQEEKLKLSLRIVEDAKTALSKANETTDYVTQLMEAYKTAVLSKNDLSVYYAKEAIFETFYGSEKAYTEHNDAVLTSAMSVVGGGEYLLQLQYVIADYDNVLSAAKDELENARNSADPLVNSEENIRTITEKYMNAQQNYLAKQEEYERRIALLELAQTDSGYELRKLRRNDTKLGNYLLALQKSIDGSGYEAQCKKLYDFLLDGKANTTQDDIAVNKLAVKRAEEDYESLKKENEKEKTDLQSDLKAIEKVINDMENGSYDYEKALEGKKQTVKAAKEVVRVAEQGVEASKLQYELSKQSDADRTVLNQRSNQISKLIIQGYDNNLQEKEKELEAVKTLLEESGEVTSPYGGIISSIGVEEGKTTSGEELIKLAVGDYVFKAEFTKEQDVNVAVKSKIKITIAGETEKRIDTEINEIMINENGISKLVAALPEDEYWMGEAAKFEITTRTPQYDLCIPIQALHVGGNSGYYIFVTSEKEDILGTELIATRAEVTVLEKNNSTVALSGALSQNDNVIIDSSKYIYDKDRVRIN